MSRQLDNNDLTVLYHALGADLDVGLLKFESVFRKVEADYQLEDIRALLDLLADPTLEDPRRLAWLHYFTIREAVLRWQLDKANALLNQEITIHNEDASLLQPRLTLLRGQIQVMGGEWVAGLATLNQVYQTIFSTTNLTLMADAEEWIGRAFIGRAQSAGDWEKRQVKGIFLAFHRVRTVVLLPFYIPLFVYLWFTNAQDFWIAAVRYGAFYSNWPIFYYYLSAYKALRRAIQIISSSDEYRFFRLTVMKADLQRRLHATHSAVSAYRDLQNAFLGQTTDYQLALLDHGLGRVYLDMKDYGKAKTCLDKAKMAYKKLNDLRGVAHVELLLGDVSILTGSIEAAIHVWKHVLDIFEEHQDAAGLAEGFSRYYGVLDDTSLSAESHAQLISQLQKRKHQVFTIRMPNHVYGFIQLLSWVIPILVALLIATYFNILIMTSSRTDMEKWAQIIISNGLFIVGGAWGGAGLIFTLLGTIGLLSTLWTEAAQLDFIIIEGNGLSRKDFAGKERIFLPWSQIKSLIRIERALWFNLSPILSFDYLYTTENSGVCVPAFTAQFRYLQQAIQRHLSCSPRCYRLHWYGGAIFLLMPFAVATVVFLLQSDIPIISVAMQAWLVSLVVGAYYAVFMFAMGRGILHYAKVEAQIATGWRSVVVASLLGLVLIGLGTLGYSWITLAPPLLIYCGFLLLFSVATYLCNPKANLLTRFVGAGRYAILVGGILLSIWTLFPDLIDMQAVTYSGAAINFHPDCSSSDLIKDRKLCFEALERVGQWMIMIDPRAFPGYGFMGYAQYYRGDYQGSIKAYDLAIQNNKFRSNADYFYCRALANRKLGNDTLVQIDCQNFLQALDTYEIGCKDLFPQETEVCKIP